MAEFSPSSATLRARLQHLLLQLPPVQRADERFQQAEHDLLHGLKQRLDALDPGELAGAPTSVHQLLEVSMEQDQDQARALLVRHHLENMTPDEARLLAALSDGSAFPMLTIYSGGRLSRGEVLYRYSSIGRTAGIQCIDLIALYLAKLFSQGLLISAPFRESLRTECELCEGDSGFRKAEIGLKASIPKLKTRRETLIISPVGRQLWELMTTNIAFEE